MGREEKSIVRPIEREGLELKANPVISMVEMDLWDALVKRQIITGVDISHIAGEKRADEGLGDVLYRLGLITGAELRSCLADYYGLAQISLAHSVIDLNAVRLIPEEIALRYRLIPVRIDRSNSRSAVLRVAMADPGNLQALEAVRTFSGMEVEGVVADLREIKDAIQRYLVVENSIAQLAGGPGKFSEETGSWILDEGIHSGEEQSPAVRLVNSLLYQAVSKGASDIHWEPQEQGLNVRFRLDGSLSLNCILPSGSEERVIARLKIMAGMDITECRIPQDGSFEARLGKQKIDMRVSSLPTVYGEKIVVRILDPDMAKRSLHELGLTAEAENALRIMLRKQHGMLLAVGPTGSGKSTTLYALLQELDWRSLNIMSVEEPVEYRIRGVNQTGVNYKTELNFAKGLRAILRQDPDVIMIGEIRDEETARIAASAALTGHLVLSTLHTKTAAEALTRLMEIGLEPYLLAASISGVLSQRLVRRLCPSCLSEHVIGEYERRIFSSNIPFEKAYKAEGCPYCNYTGYHGRVGIHELLLYSPAIKEMILARKSPDEIAGKAKEEGMVTMLENGLVKVKEGITSLEELAHSLPEL